MVERKVKLMSVQASPVVKKIVIVLAIALGCDQKNASIQPARAPISHSARMPTRMPICAATSAQVGQSFCTGRRRTVRVADTLAAGCGGRASPAADAGRAGGVLNRHRSSSPSGRCVESAPEVRVGGQQLQAALLDGDEFGRERAGAHARARQR